MTTKLLKENLDCEKDFKAWLASENLEKYKKQAQNKRAKIKARRFKQNKYIMK